MILYVNGDSHSAAAEAVNPHAFAADDSLYWGLGRQPHPDNLRVSYGCELANFLNAILVCDAESAASNVRIVRTTRNWLKENTCDLLVIQWSTWEREEWLYEDIYYQVNGSGIDQVPQSLQEKYRHYITGINWKQKEQEAHDLIWQFHQELNDQNIKHVFFNGNNYFGSVPTRHKWGASYIDPYNSKMTYNQWLLDNGYKTVSRNSYHFGEDAHSAWASFMLQYITNNKLL
jgi:hypothetical protein